MKQEELIVICQYHKSLAHKSWKLFWQEIHTVRRKLKPSIQNILKKHAPTIRKAKAKFRCILLRSLIRCVVLLQVIDDVKQCLARYSLARGYSLQPSLGIYIYMPASINSGIQLTPEYGFVYFQEWMRKFLWTSQDAITVKSHGLWFTWPAICIMTRNVHKMLMRMVLSDSRYRAFWWRVRLKTSVTFILPGSGIFLVLFHMYNGNSNFFADKRLRCVFKFETN